MMLHVVCKPLTTTTTWFASCGAPSNGLLAGSDSHTSQQTVSGESVKFSLFASLRSGIPLRCAFLFSLERFYGA